jgi:Domain of unknown function (DUF4965)/Domain of unknown function (DUF5127)/Domain of unknown function (DUF1793)/Domain of unknown function (DUF4964)
MLVHRKQMNWALVCCGVMVAMAGGGRSHAADQALKTIRPPSVPLVACDPYFSVWSPADRLTDAGTVHWTGKPNTLTSLIRIDGKAFRLIGTQPSDVPALEQQSLSVLPTRTIYTFAGAGVQIVLTFMTPSLPDEVELVAWPITYLTWRVSAIDGKSHDVAIYFDDSAELVVNERSQQVTWSPSPEKFGDVQALWMGSVDQPILAKRGDDLRIDWGYLYTATPAAEGTTLACLPASARAKFASSGHLEAAKDFAPPKPASDAAFASVVFDLGHVSETPVERMLMLAYDDVYSLQYFGKNLRSYWRRNGAEAKDLIERAAREYPELAKRCAAFDEELIADLRQAGGEDYAVLGALAYRQCWAGNKIVADDQGQPLMFIKENFSNGCIGTVDVIYPMAPQTLLFSPSLTKAMLVPILDYGSSPRWKFPFAPHDLGTYPQANGQVYGGGERTEENQMPVEESGNVLLIVAALAKIEGNAGFAAKYWPALEKWAAYLKDKGFDPENQLCTDDFAGHLAHNVNLSAKSIVALGGFAELCRIRGLNDEATEYRQLAEQFAARWTKEALEGDHYRLAFDQPNTWSQKYNLIWDRLLGLRLFPPEVTRREMDFYRMKQQEYGLALDNRKPYTKLDWTVWTASLTGDRDDFESLVAPVVHFLDRTADRVPMSDWYFVDSAKKAGFQARPVVGGVFVRLLDDPGVWKKWSGRDRTTTNGWAPIPSP